jgi:UDP-N-acetylmuramoyl-L-alanine---L-glutamate ligase
VRFSALEGRRVGVWGAGREIASFAAQLARRLPAAQIVTAAFDAEPPAGVAQTLGAPAAQIVTGEQIVPALGDCDVVVRSPGVSVHRPEMVALRERGVPVTTATALWLAEHGPEGVIGVTGTKGKSTTAALTCHLARAAGATAALAGNIGVPALDLLDAEPAQVTVVELSSYQIADLDSGPEVAVLTNLYREHTDWHGSEPVYRADKLRLLELPGVRVAVLDGREPALCPARPDVQVRRFADGDGWDVRDGQIVHAGEPVAELAQLPLRGVHNALNLCAALSALEALGVAAPALPDALADMRALPHRLEPVAERDGRLWVHDSISTTPESTAAALASFPERELTLIAGGQDRGQDYAQLGRELARAGANVIGVPSTGERVLQAAREAGVPERRLMLAGDLEQAVELAAERAGTVVLLSPAAASFDNYENFEQRGELFRELALRVTGSPGAPA